MCERPYSLLYKTFKSWFGFTALEDHFPHFKQSQTFRWSEYGIYGKKSFVSTFDPTRARTHSGEMTVWFRDSSLNLLSPRQTELQYIREEQQTFTENCLCFIQLVLLYEQKSCTYQKVVCNKFLQLERLCERTLRAFTQWKLFYITKSWYN